MGHGGGRVKRKISKQFYLPRSWRGGEGRKSGEHYFLPATLIILRGKRVGRRLMDIGRVCEATSRYCVKLCVNKLIQQKPIRQTTPTFSIYFRHNEATCVEISNAVSFPISFISFLSPLLSLFASLIQNNNSRFPRDSDYSPDGCNRKRG